MGVLLPDPAFYIFEKMSVLGGLRNNNRTFEGRQAFKFFNAAGDITGLAGVTEQADYLRVVLISDNDGGKLLFGVLADDCLHFDHPRAGGINDAKAGFFQSIF